MIPVKLLRKACACAPRRSAGEKEGAAGGSCPPNGRSSRTTVHSRPVLVLPLASTGTGVSSAWMRALATRTSHARGLDKRELVFAEWQADSMMLSRGVAWGAVAGVVGM